jgi:IS5 family transposase
MKSFEKYFMEKNYARVEELGDKLAEIDPLIDWEVFRPIIRKCMIIIQNMVVGLIMMR